MTTLTLHIENSTQDAAVRTLLDALHVKYDEVDDLDETAYLYSSSANTARLKQSIGQIEKGEGIEIDLDTLLPKK